MRRVPLKSLDYDERTGHSVVEGEPFTGVAEVIKNGVVTCEVEYREGLRWGATREWYLTGQPMVESSLWRDALHGRAREWHRNGQLAEDGEYAYGIALWAKAWDENGTLIKDFALPPGDPGFERIEEHRRRYDEP